MGESVSDLPSGRDWSGRVVWVAGLGTAGYAAADALMQCGATVIAWDSSDSESMREKAHILETLGATVTLGVPEHGGAPIPHADLLIVSPGLPPRHSWIRAAIDSGMPVWGELELAWRLRAPGAPEWLCVTGTNGKTTTTLMLASILTAAGLRTVAAGNIGVSLVDVVMHDDLDVIAVEVGAPQLPFVYSMSPWAASCINLAQDHVDHFGSFEAYRAAKARVFERVQVAAIYSSADIETRRMVEEADVIDGARAIGVTLGVPAVSELGVVDEHLVDRAFLDDRRDRALELGVVTDVHPPAPHNVLNALHAAGLARSFGVDPSAVQAGLRAFEPAGHRIATVGTWRGVTYIDDSKATNTHAALTSLMAYPSVVWIAGGLAKGQEFDDLVRESASRLRGVVLMGADAHFIADALRRHAPDVPVIHVEGNHTESMVSVVRHAAELALAGDTVLLAPGCASWDMFRDYAHRGDEFSTAVQSLMREHA